MELLAEAPARVWDRIKNNYEITGYEITPFQITSNIHRHAHQAAEEYINEHLVSIIQKKFKQDEKIGNIDFNLEDKAKLSKWQKEQSILGGRYVREMGQSFFDILSSLKEIGPSTLDRNVEIDMWKRKWLERYNNLTETAKLVATVEFIRGYSVYSDKLKKETGKTEAYGAEWFEAIPQVSKDK